MNRTTSAALVGTLGQAILDHLQAQTGEELWPDTASDRAPQAHPDPLSLVRATAEAEQVTRELLRDAVRSARAEAQSWAAIGAALGMTRQAAQQRFGHGVEPPGSAVAVPKNSSDTMTDLAATTSAAPERWLGPVTVVDDIKELNLAGRLGWHLVEVGVMRHRVRRGPTQWEHRRILWGGARSADRAGWQVVARAFPWIYLARDTGRPRSESLASGSLHRET